MIKFLNNNSRKRKANAVPAIEAIPNLWVLGTSPASASYAAEKGLPYSFGSFINDEHCLRAMQIYHQKFTPSKYLAKPYVNHAVYVICGESDDEALQLSKSSEAWFVKSFLRGEDIPFPQIEEAEKVTFTPQEQIALAIRRKGTIIGSAGKVKSDLESLTKKLAVDEFTIVTITSSFEDRLKSYKLFADTFDLK